MRFKSENAFPSESVSVSEADYDNQERFDSKLYNSHRTLAYYNDSRKFLWLFYIYVKFKILI